MYFTGSENCFLPDPYFLFIFTHRLTNAVVRFVGTQESLYPQRYDLVTIDVSTYFDGKDLDMWTYSIYEQADNGNTDETGLNMIETGFMRLQSTNAEMSAYEANNTFKTYG